MALIVSTDIEPVKVQAFGNWFEFKPGQTKNMQKNLVDFLSFDKRYLGFVALPDICEEEPDSEEAKAAKVEAIAQGRQNICKHLKELISNLEVSLTAEYERNKESVPSSAKAAHLPYYKKLAEFKRMESDKEQAAIDEIEKLKGVISGNTESTNSKPASKRS